MALLDREVRFVAALREAGVRVSVAEGLDAVRSMQSIDLLDREQFRAALAATLVKRQTQRPAFDTVFDLFWPAVTGTSVTGEPDRPPDPDAARRPGRDDPDRERLRADLADWVLSMDGDVARLDELAREAVARFGAVAGRTPGEATWSRLAALQRVSPETLMAGLLARLLAADERGGFAERRARTFVDARLEQFTRRVGAEVSRRLAEAGDAESVARTAVRPSVDRLAFLGATRTDLAAMRREIQPLARRLAARLTVQQRHGRRGPVDVRATMRASLSSGGVPMVVETKTRRPHRADLVVLCDLSESVTAFAQFTLLFVYALREQFTRVRAFGFVDELDELTRFFTPGADVGDALATLLSEADVTWLLGRTDYGRAFELFEQRYGDAIGPRTSLLVLGDARSNYGPVALPTVEALAGRARHAYWLNPERRALWDTGDSRAGDLGEIVPMVECRNLAQLSEFVHDLAV